MGVEGGWRVGVEGRSGGEEWRVEVEGGSGGWEPLSLFLCVPLWLLAYGGYPLGREAFDTIITPLHLSMSTEH